jgi:enoyl-CoA hydratase/carnithine racemase
MEKQGMTGHRNESHVVVEVRNQLGCITLNRPQALNALSLSMIRSLTDCLCSWLEDDQVRAVAIRGSNKAGHFGAFCAGGDIRFFHQAVLAGNPELEDFFTEEYQLNHLIQTYPKPYIAFMDGIVMGGGMGLSQGAKIRVVTERTRMAMPETNIGLFPDIGGGHFLGRCPGHVGEWLALAGETLSAGPALEVGLADVCFDVTQLPLAWDALAAADFNQPDALKSWLTQYLIAPPAAPALARASIDHFFSLDTALEIVHALENSADTWAQQTALTLRRRSPLMLNVALEQVRRARSLSLADDLRMERNMMRHCFHPYHLGRTAANSETLEGIRALVVDKDQQPRWQPARAEDVTSAMVAPFFDSPWPLRAHPLRDLV